MSLHPGLVGSRVVVRRRLPGEVGPSGSPALTDVVGVLERWGDLDLDVRRSTGELVTIARRDVVAGKAVPPPPTRRSRPRSAADDAVAGRVAGDDPVGPPLPRATQDPSDVDGEAGASTTGSA